MPLELDGQTVRGVGIKLPLDPLKMEIIRKIIFKIFPLTLTQQEQSWRDCRKAIDGYVIERLPNRLA